MYHEEGMRSFYSQGGRVKRVVVKGEIISDELFLYFYLLFQFKQIQNVTKLVFLDNLKKLILI